MLDEAKLWLDQPPPPPPIVDYSLSTTFSDSDEDEIDPVERERFRKQVVESGVSKFRTFTPFPLMGSTMLNFFPVYEKLFSSGSTPSTVMLSKVGLHCHNFDKVTNSLSLLVLLACLE